MVGSILIGLVVVLDVEFAVVAGRRRGRCGYYFC
jgi:hypothetical protein